MQGFSTQQGLSFPTMQLNVISAIEIRMSTKTNQQSVLPENESMKVKLHKMSLPVFPVISMGLESKNKHETTKNVFFWFFFGPLHT